MEFRGEIDEETSRRGETNEEDENKVYVAVGKDLKENQSTLLWALDNYGDGGSQICLLHVHQPAERIPIMGTKIGVEQLKAHHVAAYHELERQDMLRLLDKYNQICHKAAGVCIEVHHIERNSIEKGIVEFILDHNVKKLVMGAARDRQYARTMVELRSTKAIYVRLQAALSCRIQFICKGNLILTT